VSTTMEKLLKAQLVGHVKVHLDAGDLPQIRVVDSVQTRVKNISKASNVFVIVEKLPVYAGSCGTMARVGIRDLKQAGIILLVRSSSGLAFHVELVGSGKQLAVTRVSTGVIARDLEKAVQCTSRRSGRRGGDSELRIFRVAGMHLSAVWVHHPKKQDADVFVPYTPNFVSLRLGRNYKLHRVESLLKKHATNMILRWYDRYEKSLPQSRSLRRTRPVEGTNYV
jgi:hypothetical protein